MFGLQCPPPPNWCPLSLRGGPLALNGAATKFPLFPVTFFSPVFLPPLRVLSQLRVEMQVRVLLDFGWSALTSAGRWGSSRGLHYGWRGNPAACG